MYVNVLEAAQPPPPPPHPLCYENTSSVELVENHECPVLLCAIVGLPPK